MPQDCGGMEGVTMKQTHHRITDDGYTRGDLLKDALAVIFIFVIIGGMFNAFLGLIAK